MRLFKDGAGHRAHRPYPTLPFLGRSEAALEDDLGFLGLMPERHRADHEFRHAHPLAPGRCFTPDPCPARADIA